MKHENWQDRTNLLLGPENKHKLQKAHIAIAGLGGVGGYAAEQLCRAGIGTLTLIDADTIQPSNLNRQVIAMHSNIGANKTEAFKQRLMAINPELELNIHTEFIAGNRIAELLNTNIHFLVDAIDSLTPKVDLLETAHKMGLPTVSAMGAGGRLDINQIYIDDISKSHHCKFAYIVRKYLHRRGIREGIKVVYSTEQVPEHAMCLTDGAGNKRTVVGTISYLPAIFGCYCASVAINHLIGGKN